MENPLHINFTAFLTAIAVMLIVACLLAEFSKMIKCPGVVGELLAGILLGPTILGTICPKLYHFLYGIEYVSRALDNLFGISVIMLLFVAGMEVRLALLFRYKKAAIYTSIMGMLFPFVAGFITAWHFPYIFSHITSLNFSLFIGVALSVSALPVIARILIEVGIIKTDIGSIILTSAMLTDIIGWLIFSFILKIHHKQAITFNSILFLFITFVFLLLVFLLSRYCIAKTKFWFQAKRTRANLLLPITISVCFLWAGLTEFINIHVSLGAFIAGILFNPVLDSNVRAKKTIEKFVINFFAPLFFASIGLKVNFIQNFDFILTITIIILACASKIAGVMIGARCCGFSANESLLIGFGMNARGAMEIILSALALDAHLINESVFVALAIMSLVTSILSGFALKRINLKIKKDIQFRKATTTEYSLDVSNLGSNVISGPKM